MEDAWRPDVMPIYHSFDQHVKPVVAYYYPKGTELPEPELASAPFKPLFSHLFERVAGINPRRAKFLGDSAFEKDLFIAATREAQRALWCQSSPLTCAQQRRPELAGSHTVTYSLHADCLFGMIGHIEVKVGGIAYLVIVKRADSEASEGGGADTGADEKHKEVEGKVEEMEEEEEGRSAGQGQQTEGVQLEVLRKPTRAVVEGDISKKVGRHATQHTNTTPCQQVQLRAVGVTHNVASLTTGPVDGAGQSAGSTSQRCLPGRH
jgi:hypothetical protein